jgi:hypothetical protein
MRTPPIRLALAAGAFALLLLPALAGSSPRCPYAGKAGSDPAAGCPYAGKSRVEAGEACPYLRDGGVRGAANRV